MSRLTVEMAVPTMGAMFGDPGSNRGGERLSIVEVNRGRSVDAEQFIELPFLLHQGREQWVPGFRREVRRALGRRHRFFEHSGASFYLARRGGRPCGRIAVLANTRYNDYRDCRHATFHYFEAEDDPEAARALFDAARQWARSKGLNVLKGPQGFSAMGGGGILVDGFEHRASMTMMPWHPPYYARLIEGCGLSRHEDYYCARLLPGSFQLPERMLRVAEHLLRRGRFTMAALQHRRDLRKHARRIGEIFNTAWTEHSDSAPLSEAEIDRLASDLLLVSDPTLVKLVCYEGMVVGFLLSFPDLSAALQRGRGRLSPWTVLDLQREKRRTRTLIINGIGIMPEYQRLGANALLYHGLERAVRSRNHHYESAELLQIAESTSLMLSDMRTLGAEIHKTHRVYRCEL